MPSVSDLDEIYQKDIYHDVHYDECDYKIYENSLNWLLPRVEKSIKILDFGCGSGCFLKIAKAREIECIGVELDDSVISSSSSYSGVVVKTMEQLMGDSVEFDIIHLGDVFEHLPAPQKILSALECKLKKRGMFFIEGPLENNASIVYLSILLINAIKMVTGRYKPSSSAPLHVVRTNQKSQRDFFVNTMKYEEVDFYLYENGWPYYHNQDCSFSLGCYIKKL